MLNYISSFLCAGINDSVHLSSTDFAEVRSQRNVETMAGIAAENRWLRELNAVGREEHDAVKACRERQRPHQNQLCELTLQENTGLNNIANGQCRLVMQTTRGGQ